MSFKLKIKKVKQVPVLQIQGDITGSNIGKLTAKLEQMIKTDADKVAIDLGNVAFIDSHGLGVFVFFYRRLKERDRSLVIVNPSEFVAELLAGSNLDRIFSIIRNHEEL